MRYLGFFLILLTAMACQHRPIEELVLADVAVKAAQKVKADSMAPDTFRKAENYFLRSKRDYEEGYYDACIKHANEARMLAEQAEYQSLLRQSRLKNQGYAGEEGNEGATLEPNSSGSVPQPPPGGPGQP